MRNMQSAAEQLDVLNSATCFHTAEGGNTSEGCLPVKPGREAEERGGGSLICRGRRPFASSNFCLVVFVKFMMLLGLFV